MTQMRLVLFFVLAFMLMGTRATVAQNKERKAAAEKKQEEPPPEIVKLEATPGEEEVPSIGFDTTSVPRVKLTTAILELMELTGAMDLGVQMARNVSELQQKNPNAQLPAEFYDRMIYEMEKGRASKWLISGIVRIYRAKFTLEEINQLLAFYKTPVGRKLITTLPAIMQESMQLGEQVGKYIGIKVYLDMVEEGKLN